jgi:hypothetical protein
MRIFLLLLSMSIMVHAKRLIAVDKTYTIHCRHEFDTETRRVHNLIEIDSKKMSCYCGKTPVFVFISFGNLQCYCLYHAKLTLSTISKEEFDEQKN